MQIKDILKQNNIFLAPLAGVTDLAFRLICKEFGCGVMTTEMISAKGLTFNNKGTFELLMTDPQERPVGVQLFGSEPLIMEKAIKMIEHLPFDFIDINVGCPVPKIFNNGEGSALLKNLPLLGEVVYSAKRATNKPLTIKIRSGVDEFNINAVEAAKVIEANGADLVAIHARYRSQYYSGFADWNIIEKVKNSVKIPVIGNGDVTSPEKVVEIIEKTGCDGVMIGRAAMGNPFIFKQINDYINTGNYFEPSTEEKINTLKKHAKLCVSLKGEFLGVLEMRKHIAWYTKGLSNSSALRQKINESKTLEEIYNLFES